MQLTINTDGGARGNPGPAGIGAVIKNGQGLILAEKKAYIGESTNNQAEYKALLLGLNAARAMGGRKVFVNMDSELIVRQMQGRYKIKDPGLKLLAAEAMKLRDEFESVEFRHVPRAQNADADKLVNQAIDEALT